MVERNAYRKAKQGSPMKNYKQTLILWIEYAGCGVRTHAHLSAGDLKSPPLTTRANQLS